MIVSIVGSGSLRACGGEWGGKVIKVEMLVRTLVAWLRIWGGDIGRSDVGSGDNNSKGGRVFFEWG